MSVSVVFTSFNRINFLRIAVDSFMSLNTYPVDKIIIIDDSAQPSAEKEISSLYGDKNIFHLMFSEHTLGQPKAIDVAYDMVESDYVFHAEDDYYFDGNPDFIQDSIDIMEADARVNQVWCRHFSDYEVSHGDINAFLEKEVLNVSGGPSYRLVLKDHMKDASGVSGWCGFSWNPGLRKMSDYRTMFPDGYQGCVRKEDATWVAEFRCSQQADRHGYGAAILLNGACYNNGAGLSVHKE